MRPLAIAQRHRVILLTLGLFLVPMVCDLAMSERERVFGWVAPDTFYYLVYAQRTLETGVVGYDGVHWSNGFHPLWMAIVTLLQSLRPTRGTYLDLYWVVGLSALCQVGAFLLWARVLRRSDGTLSSWFLALPVGFYTVLVSHFWLRLSPLELAGQDQWVGPEPVYGSSWAHANGLESSLVLLAFAAVALAFCRFELRTSRRQSLLAGAFLAVFILARLDQVFIALSVWVGFGLLMRPWSGGAAARNWLALSAVPFAALCLYMLANHWIFGTALPISGKVKSTAPYIQVACFQHLTEVYNSFHSGQRPLIWVYWRVLQCVVPALFALVSPLVALSFRRDDDGLHVELATGRLSAFVLAVAPGVLVLAAYNFLFVYPSHTGHWYYPASMFFVSLVFLVALERLTSALEALAVGPLRREARSWAHRAASSLMAPRGRAALQLGLQLALIAGSLAFFVRLHRHPNYNQRYARFYFEEREPLREAFRGHEPGLLCLDDGIVAYVSGFPTMSGTGLALDVPAVKAYKSGRLIDLAQERGFDHVTSLVYLTASPLRERPIGYANWSAAAASLGDLNQKKFDVAYLSKNIDFAIVRVRNRHSREPQSE